LFSYHQKIRRSLLLPLLTVIALTVSIALSPMATAKLFDGPVDILPLEQRVSLRKGELVFLGKAGDYTSRLLIKTSIDNTWGVLTDYDNFAKFLPGVISSELIDNNGDRKVFEQVNKVKTFVFSIESRVKVATTEVYPGQISFKAIGGDLKSMSGQWTLEPVSPYPSAPPDQVLITHKVKVKPAKAPSDGIFYRIYEDRLQETLKAIKQEVEKRSTKLSRNEQ
jgi:ribosome-associated toxin RatA of RatAB toxin-antitoxin module